MGGTDPHRSSSRDEYLTSVMPPPAMLTFSYVHCFFPREGQRPTGHVGINAGEIIEGCKG
jgi:hypothetical protein